MDILIPWRDCGCPHRRANFDSTARLYSTMGNVIVGDSDPSRPFNRSAARNAAAAASTDDVCVFVDADTVIVADRLTDAHKLAEHHNGLVRPFERAGFLTESATRRYLAAGHVVTDFVHPPTSGFIGLGWVIRRDLYDQLGGFDEAFVGYGGEDNAFSAACDILYDTPLHTPGVAVSLWHPADRTAAAEVHDRVAAYYRITGWDDYRALRDDQASVGGNP